ncbi:MAG: HAD family hydrolase [Vicinamibacterales bacterium]
MRQPPGKTLLIDADDTLWENNIHFDAVVARYVELVAARGADRAEAGRVLLEIERRRTKAQGYGVTSFRASLDEACHTLLGGACTNERRILHRACAALSRYPIQLLAGVVETLQDLVGRHRVILLTKGDRDDQISKLVRSPIARRFHAVDVVAEKDRATYVDVCHRFGIAPERGWMVGNSPRSDILPALDAGLGAVFIPHKDTWVLERADLPVADAGRLIVIERFPDLLQFF